jgi:hypothetical protein
VLFFRRVAPFFEQPGHDIALRRACTAISSGAYPDQGVGQSKIGRAWLAGAAQRRHRYFLVALTGIGRVSA